LAEPIITTRDPSLRQVNLKKYQNRPVRTDAKKTLAHCLEGSHLLDVVWVEVLEL
jgi:hypothetical protein